MDRYTYAPHNQNYPTFSHSIFWVPNNVPLNSVSPYDTYEWTSSESDAEPYLNTFDFSVPRGNIFYGGYLDQEQLNHHQQLPLNNITAYNLSEEVSNEENFHSRMTPAKVGISDETIERYLEKKTYVSSTNISKEASNLNSSHDICVVCQDKYGNKDEIGILRCGHEYHVNCIKPWLRKKNKCPMCRAAFLEL